MAAIFTKSGVAKISSLAGALPVIIQMPGFQASFKAFATGFNLEGQGGQQFLHTLQDVIYVYVFGERIGTLIIQGVGYIDACSPGGNTGVDDIFNYYNQNRLSQTGQSLMITLGTSVSLHGFLVGFSYAIVDPSTGLGQFALRFAYPPV